MKETDPVVTESGQDMEPLSVADPVLVASYFFNRTGRQASIVDDHLDTLFAELSERLRIREPFPVSISGIEQRDIRFERCKVNREDYATLAKLRIEPCQVSCIQVRLPRHGSTTLDEAVTLWREQWALLEEIVTEGWEEWKNRRRHERRGQLGVMRDGPPDDVQLEGETVPEDIYIGSSRLYWAISDQDTGQSAQTDRLVDELRTAVRASSPERGAAAEDDEGESPFRQPVLKPHVHDGDLGMLWRWNEPTEREAAYQTAWLLLSSWSQNETVECSYLLNGRFAVGEAYLCKAYDHAGYYASRALRKRLRDVEDDMIALLQLKAPAGFQPEHIELSQKELDEQQELVHKVSQSYSELLLALSSIERLRLAVKANLSNYDQMVEGFALWEHPAAKMESDRLQGLLDQVEHDQSRRRASLQAFQTAIETVRARLDLVGNRLSSASLRSKQEEARRMERWEILIAILGVFLGLSEFVALDPGQRRIVALLGVPILVALLLLRQWLWLGGMRQWLDHVSSRWRRRFRALRERLGRMLPRWLRRAD